MIIMMPAKTVRPTAVLLVGVGVPDGGVLEPLVARCADAMVSPCRFDARSTEILQCVLPKTSFDWYEPSTRACRDHSKWVIRPVVPKRTLAHESRRGVLRVDARGRSVVGVSIEVQPTVDGSEADLDQIVAEVVAHFQRVGGASPDLMTVRSLVDAEWARHHDAKVRVFLPVLVRRAVIGQVGVGE